MLITGSPQRKRWHRVKGTLTQSGEALVPRFKSAARPDLHGREGQVAEPVAAGTHGDCCLQRSNPDRVMLIPILARKRGTPAFSISVLVGIQQKLPAARDASAVGENRAQSDRSGDGPEQLQSAAVGHPPDHESRIAVCFVSLRDPDVLSRNLYTVLMRHSLDFRHWISAIGRHSWTSCLLALSC